MKRSVILFLAFILLMSCGNKEDISSTYISSTSSFSVPQTTPSPSTTGGTTSSFKPSTSSGGHKVTTPTPPSITSNTPSSTVKEVFYTATFLNYDGEVLYVDEHVKEGTIPIYKGEEPTKEGTYKINYEFKGWDYPLEPIYEDMTYTALFEEEELFYTVEELITFDEDYPFHYGKEVFLEDVGIVSIYNNNTFTVTPVHNPLDNYSIEVKAKENIKDTFTSNDVVTVVGILDVKNGRPFINNATVTWGYDDDQYSADDAAYIGTVEMKDREYFENKIDKSQSGNLYYSYMNIANVPEIVIGEDITFYLTFPGEDITINEKNFYLIEARIPSLTESEAEYVSSWAKQFKNGDGIYVNLQIYYDNRLIVLLPYDLIDSSKFNVPYTHKNVFTNYDPVSTFISKEYSKDYIIFPNMENEYTYNYVTKSAYETVGNSSMKYCRISFYTYQIDELMNYLIDLYSSSEEFTHLGIEEDEKYWIDHPYSPNLDMHICIYKGFGKVIFEMHFLK